MHIRLQQTLPLESETCLRLLGVEGRGQWPCKLSQSKVLKLGGILDLQEGDNIRALQSRVSEVSVCCSSVGSVLPVLDKLQIRKNKMKFGTDIDKEGRWGHVCFLPGMVERVHLR